MFASNTRLAVAAETSSAYSALAATAEEVRIVVNTLDSRGKRRRSSRLGERPAARAILPLSRQNGRSSISEADLAAIANRRSADARPTILVS